MMSRVEELWDMAWECRALANIAIHATVREQLLETAEQFERLARHYRFHEIVRSPLKAGCSASRGGPGPL
ncbi:MAG TPA: hypothetical protein VNW24_03610 [Stellaceae bacterium]|jgi:hypothetical protein|nr:hypothetical protein [Stellaceae bacterium]